MSSGGAITLAVAVVLVAGCGFLVGRQLLRGPRQSAVDPTRRALLKLGTTLGIGFAGLAVRLTWISIVNARGVSERTGQAPDGETLSNPRLIAAQLTTERGRIVDRNGEVLASSRQEGGAWRRVYPVPEAAHLLGYFSPLRFGTAGLERARDGTLTGADPLTVEESLRAGLLGESIAGHGLQLTIDLDLQRLAASLLSGATGSAILLDHRTGRILAMASSPAYDPSDLEAIVEGDIPAANSAWSSLLADEDRPLLFRATSGLYPPGSTFKALVAASAIDAGVVTPDTEFTDDGSLDVDGYVIPEFNRPDDTRTTWSVDEGIVWSLNVVFAQVGLHLGSETLAEYAHRFGIGRAVDFDLPTSAGQLTADGDTFVSRPALAATSFGQGELLVTPLHMALVMAAIANGGKQMRPMLVDRVLGPEGGTVQTVTPAVGRTPLHAEAASTALGLLYDSVTYGYAAGAQISDLRVAGKTGTAESGGDVPHGWFIGSAGVDDPTVTVAVCLDFGGEGGGLALQIGRQLLDAAVVR